MKPCSEWGKHFKNVQKLTYHIKLITKFLKGLSREKNYTGNLHDPATQYHEQISFERKHRLFFNAGHHFRNLTLSNWTKITSLHHTNSRTNGPNPAHSQIKKIKVD